MKVLEILNEIELDSSKNSKIDIITKYKDNEVFKKTLELAYNSNILFYVKDLPENIDHSCLITLETAFGKLEPVINRKITGHSALNHIIEILSCVGEEDAEVIKRVIGKDLRCGISAKTINKVIPKLIPETPYMGAVSFNEKKAKALFKNGHRCESDIKMDGRYVNIIINSNSVDMVSRQGKSSFVPNESLIEECKQINDLILKEYNDGINSTFVLNGEMLMEGISRYEANGIIASIVSIYNKQSENENVEKELIKFENSTGMNFDEAVSKVYVVIWDFLPYTNYINNITWGIKRIERLQILESVITDFNKIKMIEYKIISSYEEAIAHFTNAVSRGEEGTILKDLDGFWKNGKPQTQIKMKLELTVDLKIVGFNEGTGKYENMLGSLICESSDGLVKADPYAFSDELRKEIWDNQNNYLNSIVEVKCNGISNDKSGNYSLLHPVFKSFRDDTTADSLEDIKENQNMIVGLK